MEYTNWTLDRFAWAAETIENWKRSMGYDMARAMIERDMVPSPNLSRETSDAFRTAFGD